MEFLKKILLLWRFERIRLDDITIPEARRYRAFLSYRTADKRQAAWLHRKLERYRVPRELVGTQGEFGKIQPRVGRIFRDRDGAKSSSDIEGLIGDQLEQSQHLVVLCTPKATEPASWVGREIEIFRERRPSGEIHAVIGAGEPPGCFPEELTRKDPTGREVMPLAADLRSRFKGGQDGRAKAVVKTIAGLIGVSFDDLWDREKRRRIAQLRAIGVSVIVFLAALFLFFSWKQSDFGILSTVRAGLEQTMSAIEDPHTVGAVSLDYDAQGDSTTAIRLVSRIRDDSSRVERFNALALAAARDSRVSVVSAYLELAHDSASRIRPPDSNVNPELYPSQRDFEIFSIVETAAELATETGDVRLLQMANSFRGGLDPKWNWATLAVEAIAETAGVVEPKEQALKILLNLSTDELGRFQTVKESTIAIVKELDRGSALSIAEQIAGNLGNSEGGGEILGAVASAWLRLGDDLDEQWWNEAFHAVLKTEPDYSRCLALIRFAESATADGKNDRAEVYWQAAFKEIDAFEYPAHQVKLYIALAESQAEHLSQSEAVRSLEKSLAVVDTAFADQRNEDARLESHNEIACSAAKVGATDFGQTIIRRIVNPNEKRDARASMVKGAHKSGRHELAKRYFDEIIYSNDTSSKEDVEELIGFYNQLGALARLIGLEQEADGFFLQALETVMGIDDPEHRDSFLSDLVGNFLESDLDSAAEAATAINGFACSASELSSVAEEAAKRGRLDLSVDSILLAADRADEPDRADPDASNISIEGVMETFHGIVSTIRDPSFLRSLYELLDQFPNSAGILSHDETFIRAAVDIADKTGEKPDLGDLWTRLDWDPETAIVLCGYYARTGSYEKARDMAQAQNTSYGTAMCLSTIIRYTDPRIRDHWLSSLRGF